MDAVVGIEPLLANGLRFLKGDLNTHRPGVVPQAFSPRAIQQTEVCRLGDLPVTAKRSSGNGVQVFPVPTAGFTVTPFADVPENTVFTFDNTSSTEFMLNWDFGDGSAAGSGPTTTHEYAGSGLFDVTLTAINNYGCAATHVETVDVGATLMVFAPTAFTPGGQGDFGIARPDGINDGWRPEIRGIEHVDEYWLQVFNRWGDVVWETRDPAAVWDGGMPGEVGERFYTQDEVLNWRLRLSTSGDVKFDGGDGADDGSRSYRGIVTILR